MLLQIIIVISTIATTVTHILLQDVKEDKKEVVEEYSSALENEELVEQAAHNVVF
jgi:hypothetical protein